MLLIFMIGLVIFFIVIWCTSKLLFCPTILQCNTVWLSFMLNPLINIFCLMIHYRVVFFALFPQWYEQNFARSSPSQIPIALWCSRATPSEHISFRKKDETKAQRHPRHSPKLPVRLLVCCVRKILSVWGLNRNRNFARNASFDVERWYKPQIL